MASAQAIIEARCLMALNAPALRNLNMTDTEKLCRMMETEPPEAGSWGLPSPKGWWIADEDGLWNPRSIDHNEMAEVRQELKRRGLYSSYVSIHVKLHSFVIYDPRVGFLNQLFELDGQLFHDAQFMLYKARQIQGEAKSQRDLPPGRHRVLHTLLRSVVSALFTFIEAYLNGIAFDCFQTHHDTLDLDDHDFLGEWNSAKKQRKFVKFDDKVFGYPKLIAKLAGRQIDLSGLKPAHRIIKDGKDIRDAITHPSAQYDPELLTQKKLTLLAGLRLPEMESLYADMCEYVKFVEEGIGNDPKQSAPWLFDEFGFSEAKNESI